MSKTSILQDDMTECWFCKRPAQHIHHIYYGTANRRQSERYHCCVGLCAEHHTLSGQSVHFNRDMDLMLKKECQKAFETKVGTRQFFIQLFGRSYLK